MLLVLTAFLNLNGRYLDGWENGVSTVMREFSGTVMELCRLEDGKEIVCRNVADSLQKQMQEYLPNAAKQVPVQPHSPHSVRTD